MAVPAEPATTQVQDVDQWKPTMTVNDTGGATVSPNHFNVSAKTYTPTGTPPVDRTAQIEKTITATGVPEVIDLTALPSIDANIDGTTKKVQGIRIQGASTNVGTLTIAPGAATPYELFGTTNTVIIPGKTRVLKLMVEDDLAAISSSLKHIDVTGTINDVWKIEIILG